MAKTQYVVNVKHRLEWGAPDGTQHVVREGEAVPSGVSDEQLLQLRQSLTVVPKAVFDAQRAARHAQLEAEKAKAEADAEASRVLLEAQAGAAEVAETVDAEAAKATADAQPSEPTVSAPPAPAVQPKTEPEKTTQTKPTQVKK